MTETQEILKRLERIEKQLKENRPSRHWVKVSVIQSITGWDKNQMVKARENGLVTQRRGDNGIEYLLESVPPQFIQPMPKR